MDKEKIIIVDSNDEVIGQKDRNEITPDDIYRVSALWITNSKGDVLLAKRSLKRPTNPGKWGPGAAGTVEVGETYYQNIIKEAEEELGLKNISPNPGPKLFVDGKRKHFTQFYFLEIEKPPEQFVLQEEEVAEIKWVPRQLLEELLSTKPEDFSPNFKKYYAKLYV